jgi:transposase
VIPVPSGVKVWLASGATDMRRGMNGLALQVQQVLEHDPHICVGRDYVAASRGGGDFRAMGRLGRHII